jgi:protease-4
MKMKHVLLVIGIAVFLMLLFTFSVFVAYLLHGDRQAFLLGEGVGIVEVKGMITDSKDTIKQLQNFEDNEKVKAVVLRIDSPGGVVGPTQEIYEEVGKLTAKKKVVVSMGSVAASGGYYIAAPANMIFANPGTLTGSIGVLMELSNIEGLLGKIGLKSYVLKSGEFKDTGSPVRKMTAADKAVLQSVVDSMYGQFVKAVATGRKMPVDEVRRLADGRVYSGEQALRLKLVDRLGNLQDAVAEAARLAGIKGEPEVIYPPEKKKMLLDWLVEGAAEKLAGKVKEKEGVSARYEFGGI